MAKPTVPIWRTPTSGLPFFGARSSQGRERSGSDLLILIVSLLLTFGLASIAVPPTGFEKSLTGVVDAVPKFLSILWRFGVAALVIWTLSILITSALRKRGDVLLDVVATALGALAIAVVVQRFVQGSWPSTAQVTTGGGHGSVPLAALAFGAGVAFAASPHLSMPFRRLGRWIVWTTVLSTVLLRATTITGALLTVCLAAAAAAIVHLALGSSNGRPSLEEVSAALEELGLSATDLSVAPRQPGGVLIVDAIVDGAPVVAKVYGRDARDTQLMSRLRQMLWYRHAGPVSLSRQQQVEHEGFVTLLAEGRGVNVPTVLVAGTTASGDALVVVSGGGTPLSTAAKVSDEQVHSLWQAVTQLHDAKIVHGSLSTDAFSVEATDDGDAGGAAVQLRDLGDARVAPVDALIQTDLAQALVCTALTVGIERAVVIAADELGEARIEAMLPYLQVPAMPRPLRRTLHDSDIDIDAIRSAAAGVIGVEEPEIVQLRRVSPQTLIMIALLIIVAFTLITSLSEVDPAELWHTITSGKPVWLVSAVVFAQLPFLSQAVATRGASPRSLPFGPVVMLQASIAFVGLAVPSTAGRLALGIRFFQRQGVPPAAAVSISAVDSFSGFLVQISLLILTLVFGLGAVDMHLDLPKDSNLDKILILLAIVAGVSVLAAAVALAMPKVRHKLMERIRPLIGQATEVLHNLKSISKLLQLFGGNLANQLLYGGALGLTLFAFGGRLNLATLVVVYVAAALFGGLMPVPGGIGVMEAALMAGLIAAGIDNATATATAITFRAFTFYLPPLWGWLALRWLQRGSYL